MSSPSFLLEWRVNTDEKEEKTNKSDYGMQSVECVFKHSLIVWGRLHLLNSIERGNTCWRDVKIIQIGYLIYEWYVLSSSFLCPFLPPLSPCSHIPPSMETLVCCQMES
jgi:hypothetical protein